MKNFKIEQCSPSKSVHTYLVPKYTKSVTVSSSGRIKFELVSKSETIVGTGFGHSWSTSTLLIDKESETETLRVFNCDMIPFDIYIHFNI